MSLKLRKDEHIFLIGSQETQILGSKLPSLKQVFQVFFFNLRTVKLNIRESANLVIRECIIFWEKARIPTRALQHCVNKLIKMYDNWRNLQKNAKVTGEIYRKKENEFILILDSLFDIAHSDALNIMKIDEDKQFLINQRLPGRPGCLSGVDKKETIKENRREIRKSTELNKQTRCCEQVQIASTSMFNSMQLNENVENETDSSDNEEISDTNTSVAQEETQLSPLKKKRRGKINFITHKLAGALDRCKLSVRDSVYVLQATLEALGFDNDDYIINSSSIHRAREMYRCERAKMIKSRFQESRPSYVIVHWDGKLLPNIHVKNTTVERLPIIVTSKNIEQIIGVPILQRSTGEEQATAVYNALDEWGLLDVVQGLCCDTTSSNMGRLNGSCILIQQKLDKDLLYLPCRHHIYELVLRSVFETKIPQVTTSPSIPLFKNFQKKWIDIDSSNFISGLEDQYCSSAIENIREDILNFVRSQLEIKNSRDDYKEFLELVLIFIGGHFEKKIKIHPPGAMHQARWMARAIYCLKIFIFRHQYHVSANEKKAIGEVCIFIVKFYVKAWFTCTLPIKAPNLDLQFIKSLKSYEIVDSQISTAAIKKLCNHLWYLNEEAAALAFFDESIPLETKQLMVKALKKKSSINSTKRLILQPYQIDGKFNGEYII